MGRSARTVDATLGPSDGPGPRPIGVRTFLPAALAVLRRPHLWSTAVRAGFDLSRPGWWRRSPFLPLPDPGWLRFRLVTAYGGDGSGPVRGADIVDWLEWRRAWRPTGR